MAKARSKKKGAMKGCTIGNKCKSKAGGLTAKGRRMINRKTGSKLKAPQPGGGSRKKSYCARSSGIKSDRCSANYWARRDWDC